MVILVGVAYAATRNMKRVPGRLQVLVELGIEKLLNFVESIAGKENSRRFFPVVATIFLFVIVNAYVGLLPICGHGILSSEEADVSVAVAGVVSSVEVENGDDVEEGDILFRLETGEAIEAPMNGEVEDLHIGEGDQVGMDDHVASIERHFPLLRGANTDVNMPLTFALVSFVFVEFWGLSSVGFTRYMRKFFDVGRLLGGFGSLIKGRPRSALGDIFRGGIDAFVGILELLSEFIRIISFTFRLFGNMTAGEILLATIASLIPLLLVLPFYGLELLVGFVQALIFAGLTVVFATMAVTAHDEEHE